MGLKVTAAEAARLANRGERTIRQWIALGRLPATPAGFRAPRKGVGPSRWLVDTDDLTRMPGVTIDRARLAELETQRARNELGESVLERLARLEEHDEAMRRRMDALELAMRALLNQPSEQLPASPSDTSNPHGDDAER